MNVSVIIPAHNPDKVFLKKIENSIKTQKFNGKIEIKIIEKGFGLAKSLNYGIKKSKYDILVSFHQDCIPENEFWLKKLTKPLKQRGVVASVSKIKLPIKFWKRFGFFTKILTKKERGVLTPLFDGKGCAFKKSAILKVGLFDFKNFRTAGEDFDMYIKLKKIGKIKYPDCKIYHLHNTNFNKRLKKEIQYANGFGALVRIHKKEMPSWIFGILKAIPFFGAIFFLISYLRGLDFKFLFLFPISLLSNLLWSYGFWKGFLNKKETI
tara:strand:- start:3020 stop:3817 length:798 start_codon:yes stop_codon:yes gene_type:complete